MKFLLNFFCYIIFVINFCYGVSQPKEIIINGSNTVSSMLFEPYQQEIEKLANINLKIEVNGSVNGLRDLALGRCDIAMIAASFKSVADTLNDKLHGFINLRDYREYKVGESKAVFIINKSNPVDYISLDQLRRICRGDIMNWKAVGGKDQRILFFTTTKGSGARTTIQDQLLEGDFFGVYTTELRDSHVLEAIVSHLSEAIGTDSLYNINDSVKVVKTDREFVQPLILVTKGEANPELEKIIDIVRNVFKNKIELKK